MISGVFLRQLDPHVAVLDVPRVSFLWPEDVPPWILGYWLVSQEHDRLMSMMLALNESGITVPSALQVLVFRWASASQDSLPRSRLFW